MLYNLDKILSRAINRIVYATLNNDVFNNLKEDTSSHMNKRNKGMK